MDTRFLESFLIVAQRGSIAEAARQLDLTPAALAQRVRALESELGVRLLVRAGRTVQPTEAGRAILKRAEQILRDTRELRAVATSGTAAGRLRIGVIATAVTGIMPTILSFLAKSCPQLEIYVVPGISGELYTKLLDDKLDAAILVQPPFRLGKYCNWMLLRKEPLVVISPASVPIINTRMLLMNEPFIRYNRKHWGGRIVDNYLQRAKITPCERFELDALDAIAVLVARGLGVSLVPDWAPPWPEGLVLNKTSIDAPAFVRHIGLLWMRNSANIRLVQIFRTQARAALGM